MNTDLLIQTTTDSKKAAEALASLYLEDFRYELPEIIATQLERVSAEYATWMEEQL